MGAAQNAFYYGHGDIYDVAAAYAFHIAQAQAFLDGNKRTAISTALVFLAGNGKAILPTTDFMLQLYNGMIAIADRRLDKTGLAKVSGISLKTLDKPQARPRLIAGNRAVG